MAKLYFYYASMNAGKSTTLLQANFNYHERGMTTMLWTAQFDDRGGEKVSKAGSGCIRRRTALHPTPTSMTGSAPRTRSSRWLA